MAGGCETGWRMYSVWREDRGRTRFGAFKVGCGLLLYIYVCFAFIDHARMYAEVMQLSWGVQETREEGCAERRPGPTPV